MPAPWYQALFANYAKTYDTESFTRGTTGEVDFLEMEIGGDRTKRILDVGCGTGRHAIELATRGFHVTGIDLSEAQLERARSKAAETGVNVQFLKRDARNFTFDDPFELIIMLCEGAFPLMETDEENVQILENVTASLKPGGKLILTTLNGLFPLFHSVKDFINANARNDHASAENTFDLMTFRDLSTFTFVDDDGKEQTVECNERYYTPPEMIWLLKSLGLRNIAIHGCKIGAFSRQDPLTTEDYEMLVIAEKPLK